MLILSRTDLYQKNGEERLQSIDLIKLIAMIGVVALHTFSKDFIYAMTTISVPLFFMVTGYLQLGKKKISYYYCRQKIINIIKFVTIISFIDWLICIVWLREYPIKVTNFISYVFGGYFQIGGCIHFWFFGALIIVYLFMPLINKLYIYKFKRFAWLTGCLIVIMSIVFIQDCLHLKLGNFSEQNLIQTFRIYNWLGYFCIGGFLKIYQFKNMKWLWLIIFLAFINYYFQQWLIPFIANDNCEYFYDSLPALLLCIAIFYYCISLKISNSQVIENVSTLFLPVYALHYPLIPFYKDLLEMSEIGLGPYQLYLFVLTFIATIVISILLMKIPLMKKIFNI